MDFLGCMEFVSKVKNKNNEENAYALLRWYDNQNVIEELIKIPSHKALIEADYFPKSLEVIIKRRMHYSTFAKDSISNLLTWGTNPNTITTRIDGKSFVPNTWTKLRKNKKHFARGFMFLFFPVSYMNHIIKKDM